MLSAEAYGKIISELLDELPEDFFRELSGGVIVSEAQLIPDYARGTISLRWGSIPSPPAYGR